MSKNAGGYIGEALGEGLPKPKAKRPKTQSPTSRTLEELRKLGFEAGVVERRVPNRWDITIDLFGCIDIVAAREGSGLFGIQATTGAHHAARRTKAIAEPKLATWLKAGGRFEVWSWEKQGAAGARKLWKLRREEITLKDIAA